MQIEYIEVGNVLDGMEKKLDVSREKLLATENQLQSAKAELEKPFLQEEELREKSARLIELDHILSLNENVQEGEIVVDDVIDNESLERKEYVQR